jgi:hypothetical protein
MSEITRVTRIYSKYNCMLPVWMTLNLLDTAKASHATGE